MSECAGCCSAGQRLDRRGKGVMVSGLCTRRVVECSAEYRAQYGAPLATTSDDRELSE